MSSDAKSDRRGQHGPPVDGLAEFTEELRLLAEALLERVEPVLRRTAVDGRPDLGGCGWCPMCAAAALVRGDHHDVVSALAEHGTAVVTILREALAGIPVDPLLPPEWDDHAAHYGFGSEFDSAASAFVRGYTDGRAPGGDRSNAGDPDPDPADDRPGAGVGLWSTRYARPEGADPVADSFASFVPEPGPPTPTGQPPVGRARVQPPTPPSGIPATDAPPPADTTGQGRHRSAPPQVTPEPGDTRASRRTGADSARSARAPRSRYVDIPVTIRG